MEVLLQLPAHPRNPDIVLCFVFSLHQTGGTLRITNKEFTSYCIETTVKSRNLRQREVITMQTGNNFQIAFANDETCVVIKEFTGQNPGCPMVKIIHSGFFKLSSCFLSAFVCHLTVLAFFSWDKQKLHLPNVLPNKPVSQLRLAEPTQQHWDGRPLATPHHSVTTASHPQKFRPSPSLSELILPLNLQRQMHPLSSTLSPLQYLYIHTRSQDTSLFFKTVPTFSRIPSPPRSSPSLSRRRDAKHPVSPLLSLTYLFQPFLPKLHVISLITPLSLTYSGLILGNSEELVRKRNQSPNTPKSGKQEEDRLPSQLHLDLFPLSSLLSLSFPSFSTSRIDPPTTPSPNKMNHSDLSRFKSTRLSFSFRYTPSALKGCNNFKKNHFAPAESQRIHTKTWIERQKKWRGCDAGSAERDDEERKHTQNDERGGEGLLCGFDERFHVSAGRKRPPTFCARVKSLDAVLFAAGLDNPAQIQPSLCTLQMTIQTALNPSVLLNPLFQLTQSHLPQTWVTSPSACQVWNATTNIHIHIVAEEELLTSLQLADGKLHAFLFVWLCLALFAHTGDLLDLTVAERL
ncbi:hypothetical protein BLNAU_21872 [Blattamonas nauphoetae]|uniref:Uncharacterized protein n=1 Tax=Blattamonas nauphoetae TaxID=2049346 RepID=A0ABQ9WUN3_9EUKA|nr:hypothetical protein BLNAU_21872 [Blattamonas nauphoetae]